MKIIYDPDGKYRIAEDGVSLKDLGVVVAAVLFLGGFMWLFYQIFMELAR